MKTACGLTLAVVVATLPLWAGYAVVFWTCAVIVVGGMILFAVGAVQEARYERERRREISARQQAGGRMGTD